MNGRKTGTHTHTQTYHGTKVFLLIKLPTARNKGNNTNKVHKNNTSAQSVRFCTTVHA